MRTASANFKSRLANEVTSLCLLWTITRADGTIIRFTDTDQDVVYDGNTYATVKGFTATAVSVVLGSQTSGLNIACITDDTVFLEADIRAGLFNSAICEIDAIQWEHTADGKAQLFKGTFGNIEISEIGEVDIEVFGIGLLGRLLATQKYSPSCRAQFGDERCGVDLDALEATFTVDVMSITSLQSFTTLELSEADEYWTFGVLKFETGPNAGLAFEIMKSTSATKEIKLFVPLPFPAESGDTGVLVPGCSKQFSMCRDRWNNKLNFRGENLVAVTE